MAETVVSFVIEETLGRVVSLITEEIILAWNLKKDIKGLRETLTMIRAVLQDAEDQQTKREPVRLWLKKLEQVAYDAEDVFDELAYESLRRKVESDVQDQPEKKGISSSNLFSRVARYAKKPKSHLKIAHQVKNINESLAKIHNEAVGFRLQVTPKDPMMPPPDSDRVTDSVLDNPVVGRESDVSKIVDLLCCSCSQQLFTVVPIVGMGGLGKTDLAKLVCQEVLTRKLFDVKMWICVSDKFDGQRILGEMLQSLNGNMGGLTNKDAIIGQLEKQLDSRKFLLVLDDVWEDLFVVDDDNVLDDVPEKWDGLMNRLSSVAKINGSAIVVTTRSERVASAVETSPQHRHNLNILSDEDCWCIIKNGVCRSRNAPISLSELEPVGREVAKRCRGVPLVAKVLGGTMRLHRNKETWLSILNSGVFNGSDYVRAALKLSFDHLPSYLKPCFAYCSIFPKDTLIEKEQLIQLWMAEGFVTHGYVGEKYFNVLLWNSFFQDVERDIYNITITGCKIHDLVHDLAISLSKSESLTSENWSLEADLSCIRRINVDSEDVRNSMVSVDRKLRTLFLLKECIIDKSWELKNLRTLNLKGAKVEELPSTIGEWKLLKYLDVSETGVKELPESITKLYNLQTLRFLECAFLRELPRKKINNLVSLKNLEFSYDLQMPSELGKLTCLERLTLFVVGSNRGGGIHELEGLNELRGRLTIKQLEKVRDREEARKANMEAKKRLTFIEYQWSSDRGTEGYSQEEEVLEALQPHANIEILMIEFYMGEKFPEWIMKMKVPRESGCFTLLNNLVRLTIFECNNCEQVPSLGNLPSLKDATISGMMRVKYIGNELYGIDMMSNERRRVVFPALKHLSLTFMHSLVEWKAPEVGDEVVVFPCLESLSIGPNQLTKIPITDLPSLVRLDISECNEYTFDDLHSFPSLKSLNISNCDKLTCIPSALQSFVSLEEFGIDVCGSLASIPQDLGKLTSLVSLEIIDCKRLSNFPEEIIGSLTRLKKLRIGDFSEDLDDYSYLNSIHYLTSLEELAIFGNYRVKLLPEQLKRLTSLKTLYVHNFYVMAALPEWLGDLSSLQSLNLYFCKNLKNLPSPTAMKRLSKLRNLEILLCDHLGDSCIKGSGSEWNKISHIPNIKIDYTRFSGMTRD